MDACPNQPTVSVMITTRNRVDDLRRTWSVLRGLNPPPLEILITADGCTDETFTFVREEIPQARLFVHATGRGSIASRDAMMRQACGDLVLSLDDDSFPVETDCLARIADEAWEHPQAAVLHFPQRSDEYPETLRPTFGFGLDGETHSFSSAGAVLRRAVYLELTGFRPWFFHAYEEPDYALQCVAAGWKIRFTSVVHIRHHYSPALRNELRTHQHHARNECWSAFVQCPFPQVVPVVAYRAFSQLRYAFRRGLHWAVREPHWWGAALAGLAQALRHRRPVTWEAYRNWLRLPDRGVPRARAEIVKEKPATVESPV
jgi:GT2 family glycosyltransferase